MKSLEPLIKKLGYEFKNRDLLEIALTHRSAAGKNNERLEFLGDAALNLIIAEAIYKMFEYAKEGQLSRLRAHLVKGESLAKLAREMQLSEYLNLGIGEVKSGGAKRDSILADAMEALIGAIYLDSDFATCQKILLTWFEPYLKNLSAKNIVDAKTLLQEYLQAHKFSLPKYEIIKTIGAAHEQTFYVACKVENLAIITEGEGKSRRKAEQDAAQKFLNQLQNHG